ncbi:MAG: VanZ family protein [Gammaproteobacteria bacterium]
MLDLRLKAWWWVAGTLMLLVVLVLCLVPLSLEREQLVSFEDKIVHALIFLVLMVWFSGLVHREHFWWVFALLLLYGGSIEILQGLGGSRSAEFLDFVADACGLLLGLWLAKGKLGDWCRHVEIKLGIPHES